MDPETGSRDTRLTSGQDTWSARCAETCTSGAAGGPGKPITDGARMRAESMGSVTALSTGDNVVVGAIRAMLPALFTNTDAALAERGRPR
jgi:hypothetical protein